MASPAFVSQATAINSAAASSFSVTIAATGANRTLVAFVTMRSTSDQVTSITDTAGNVWVYAEAGRHPTSSARIEAWYALNAASVTSVTINLNDTVKSAANISVWSGVRTAGVFDGSTYKQESSTTSLESGSLTTNVAQTLLLAGAVSTNTTSTRTLGAGSGFTALTEFSTTGGSDVKGTAAYRIASAVGAYEATWTESASANYSSCLLALRGEDMAASTVEPLTERAYLITQSGSTQQVNYWSTAALTTVDTTVTRLVFSLHGVDYSPRNYAYNAIDAAKLSSVNATTRVISPYFPTSTLITNSESPARTYWSAGGWQIGSNSETSPYTRPWVMPSFEVLDRMIRDGVAACTNVQEVIVVGHSAGGQFAHRHGMTTLLDTEAAFDNITIRWVPVNPGTFTYLDTKRNKAGVYSELTAAEQTAAPLWNTWEYGLTSRGSYSSAYTDQSIRDQYQFRRVSYLNGSTDTATTDLDVTAEANWQGANRYERSQWYAGHLPDHYGTLPPYHTFTVATGVSHNGHAMYISTSGLATIYAPVVAAPQYARPTSDVTVGLWTPSTGVSLSAMLDEVTPSDTDYIESQLSPSLSVARVGLGSVTDPVSSANHIVRYRMGKDITGGATIDGAMWLYQNTTLIATFPARDNVDALKTYMETLTGAQADAITDYADLRLRMSATETVTPAAPTFVNGGSASATATSGANLTPGLPTGWAADDIHILVMHRSDNTAATAPTGWTRLSPSGVSESNTIVQRVEVFWRRAVAGDTAPVITFGSGTIVRIARIYGFRGCPTSGSPFNGSVRTNNAASATITGGTVTTTTADTLGLFFGAYEDDPTTATPSADWGAALSTGTILGNDCALYLVQRTLATAGTYASNTMTVSGGTFTNSVNVGIILTLVGATPAARKLRVTWAELEVPAGVSVPSLTGAYLSPATTLYSATITPANRDLTAAYLSPVATLYLATISAGPSSLSAGYLAQVSTLYPATVSAGNRNLTAAYLAPSSTLYAATTSPGAMTLTASYLAPASTLYPATVTVTTNLAAAYLSPASLLYAATITPANRNLTAAYLSPAATLYPATISAGASNVSAAYLSPASALYVAALNAGNASLTAAYLPPSATLYAATITPGNRDLTAAYLSPASTLYTGAITTGLLLAANYLSPSSSLFLGTLAAGNVSLNAAFLSSTATLYAATTSATASLPGAYLAPVSALYPATITAGAVLISATYLGSTSALYAAMLAAPVSLFGVYLATGSILYPGTLRDLSFYELFVTGSTLHYGATGSMVRISSMRGSTLRSVSTGSGSSIAVIRGSQLTASVTGSTT